MKFALDAMGGDFAPKSVVLGGLNAIEKASSPIKIIFLGDRDLIGSELKGFNTKNIEIIHTDETINIKDKSSTVIKTKPNSSLVPDEADETRVEDKAVLAVHGCVIPTVAWKPFMFGVVYAI
jgi:fatty acid/phospholipid biosynthesis enzyme